MGLVAVSQDSMMAEQASSEGAINICREYRRCVCTCAGTGLYKSIFLCHGSLIRSGSERSVLLPLTRTDHKYTLNVLFRSRLFRLALQTNG